MVLTDDQNIFLLKAYYRSAEEIEENLWDYSYPSTYRQFKNQYPELEIQLDSLFRQQVRRIVQRFENCGSIQKGKSTGRHSQRTENLVGEVKRRVDESPTISIRKLATETGLSRTTTHRILKQDLPKLYNSKMETHLSCQPNEIVYIKPEQELMLEHEEEIVLKQEEDGQLYEEWIECKTEIIDEIHIKDESQEPIEKDVSSSEENADETYACDSCKTTWSSSSNNHKENPSSCNYCGQTFKKLIKCSYCEATFSKISVLNIHNRTHTDKKPFQCTVCEKNFSTTTSLKLHDRLHTGETPFQCSVCERRFKSSSNLRQHEKIHTDEKPYKCSACERSFHNSSNLKRHERLHSIEKDFQCEYCQKKFSTAFHLNIHTRVHTGEEPYQCTICEKRFKSSSNLKTHEKMHTTENAY